MGETAPLNNVIEAADKLSIEEQEELIEVLSRRLIQRRRHELADDIKEAEEEFRTGGCPPRTPAEIMKEILS